MKECWRGLSPVTLEPQTIQVAGVAVRARCEPEPVELVLAVVPLPVKGPSYTSVLLLVLVQELDGAFPTRQP